MRFLSADFLFTLEGPPIKNGVLQITNEGKVLDVFNDRTLFSNDKLELFSGIITPGFVNSHCHLELSHMHNQCKSSAGLIDFINNIRKRNDSDMHAINKAISHAEKKMIENGIVAVGDICNTNHTIKQKSKRNLLYYSFIEGFCIHDYDVERKIRNLTLLKEEFRLKNLNATIVPHAPYSVTPTFLKSINNLFDKKDKLVSIHFNETESEKEFFKFKTGDLFEYFRNMSASDELWNFRRSLNDVLMEISFKNKLLVHNTYSTIFDMRDYYYCTCPKANLYIEGVLPNYDIFDKDKLCVGTDSLASNDSLSVLEEIYIVQENSAFDLNSLLKISSKNGAKALGFKHLGSFKKGKKPGVLLIKGIQDFKIQKNSIVRRLD